MTIAFLLLTTKRSADLFFYLTENKLPDHDVWFLLIDIIVSMLIITGVYGIKRILKNVRNSERDLQASEKRFRELFNSSSDEIFLADFEGRFLEVNNEACRRLGYSRDEFLEMNFRDIKTPKYVDSVSINIETIRKNKTHVYETEHISKDKKIVYLEMNSRVVDYEGREAILTIARDITERKELERKILSATIETEERERKRFAKEMHDGLGPLLSTIKLYVNEMLSDEIEKEEKVKFVNYTNELIDDAISNIRTISDNLMPRLINEYGLVKAIESICKKINATGKVKIDFISKGFNGKLDQNIELVFFRVTEELINNTLKHANASNIKIFMCCENSKLDIEYHDNGIGCNINDVYTSSKAGIGVKNIISRIKSLNATYIFFSPESGGFGFKAEVEIK